MILLSFNSMVLENTILKKFQSKGKGYTHITLCDFDGCQYDVTSDKSARNIIVISISWAPMADLKPFGAFEKLDSVYGGMKCAPANGFDYAVKIDVAGSANPAETAKKISLMKRHAFAAVFEKSFNAAEGNGSVPDLITIKYRQHEAMYLKKTDGNRVVCIFSINFQDKDDVVYSQVFLKELADVRKTISAAPPVLFSMSEPPLELSGVSGLYSGDDQGYISFVLFPGKGDRREKTMDNIMMFRNYLMYHIKCAKAYLNIRMRRKCAAWLKVLNRAKMPAVGEKEKKTITGRTFKRK